MAKVTQAQIEAIYDANNLAVRPGIGDIAALLTKLAGDLYNAEIIPEGRTGSVALTAAEAGLPRLCTNAAGISFAMPADAAPGITYELIMGAGVVDLEFPDPALVRWLGGSYTGSAIGQRARARCTDNPGGTAARWQFWGFGHEVPFPPPRNDRQHLPYLPAAVGGGISWRHESEFPQVRRAIAGTAVTDETGAAIEGLELAGVYRLPAPADEAGRGGPINRGRVEFRGVAARLIIPARPAVGFRCLVQVSDQCPALQVEPAEVRTGFSLNGVASTEWTSSPLILAGAPALYELVANWVPPDGTTGAEWSIHEVPPALSASARWGNPNGAVITAADADIVLTRRTLRKKVRVFPLTVDRSVFLPTDLSQGDDGTELWVEHGGPPRDTTVLNVMSGASVLRSLVGGSEARFIWDGPRASWDLGGPYPSATGGWYVPQGTGRFRTLINTATDASRQAEWGPYPENPARAFVRYLNLADHPTNAYRPVVGPNGDGHYFWLFNRVAGAYTAYNSQFTIRLPNFAEGAYTGLRFHFALVSMTGTGSVRISVMLPDGVTVSWTPWTLFFGGGDQIVDLFCEADGSWLVQRGSPRQIFGPDQGYLLPNPFGKADGQVAITANGNYVLAVPPSPAALTRNLSGAGFRIGGFRADGRNQALPYTLAAGDTGLSLNLTGTGNLTVPAATTLLEMFEAELVNDTGANVTLDGPGGQDLVLPANQLGAVKVRNGKLRMIGTASAI
jgi:hypothetical protein